MNKKLPRINNYSPQSPVLEIIIARSADVSSCQEAAVNGGADNNEGFNNV